MKQRLFIFSLSALFSISSFAKTSQNNKGIEITFHIKEFITGYTDLWTDPGSSAEQEVNELFVFLFPTSKSQSLLKFEISSNQFKDGNWIKEENRVFLNTTPLEVGKRDVYMVANYLPLKDKLNKVASVSELQKIFVDNTLPWESKTSTTLLKSGYKTHDFNLSPILSDLALTHSVAKLEVNIALSDYYQWYPVQNNESQYWYKFTNFNPVIYPIPCEQENRTNNSSINWTKWQKTGNICSYNLSKTGKVTKLTLTTYLNEQNNGTPTIEIKIPAMNGTLLPPPEFIDKIHKLELPNKIERGYWYLYEIDI